MKILFVCENYLPHYGGAEVVFKNLAEGYAQRGHQVSLLTHWLKGTKKRENINGVEVHRVSSFFSRYFFTFAAVPKAIKLAQTHDIVQTTSFNGAPPAWLAGKLAGKPVVITVHEIWKGKWKLVTGFSWFKSQLHELLERAIYLLPYDKYVCVSNATKNDLLKTGIRRKKVLTVYNGMDYHFWNPKNFLKKEALKIRKELGLQNNFVYFSWGRPGASKGFEYVIKAVPLIKQKVPNSKFLLMLGSIDKYPIKYKELMHLIRKLHLEEDIKVLPSVPYNQLGNYIKAADCVVIPSIAEGFGYTANEAIALGKPVAVSNAGSLPEVVSGKYQIFESKNPADLAEKAVKIARMEFMVSPAKRFEWAPSISTYLQVYEELIAKK